MTRPGDVELCTLTELGPEVDELAPEWDELARQVGSGFAARPTYALAWWEAHGHGRPALVTARRSGRLVAVAPLHRRRLGGREVLRWLGHGQDVLGEVVAADPAAAQAVWRHLVDDPGPLLQLARTRLGGLLALRRLHALQPEGRLRISAVGHGRLLARLGAHGLEQSRARPSAPPAAVELLTDVAGLRETWPQRRSLPAPDVGVVLDDELLEVAAKAGDLVVAGARVDGLWVAQATLLRRGGSLELWSLCTASSVDRLVFGDLLVRSVLDRSADLGVEQVDLALGGAELEGAWPGEGYDVVTLLAASGSVGLAALGALQAVEDARRRRGAA